jgi:hypothetical protein
MQRRDRGRAKERQMKCIKGAKEEKMRGAEKGS